MTIILRAFAGFIDGLQFLFFAAFVALGAGAGSALCGGLIPTAVCAVASAATGVGVAILAFPLGVVLAYVLGIPMGAVLILVLAGGGMFYPSAIVMGFLGETIPILNFLPFWSIMVHYCIKFKNEEEAAQTAQGAPSAAPRTTRVINTVDGISAANDNQKKYANAA